MWRRIVVGNEKPVVMWKKDGITEVYDRNALELNIERCNNRLATDTELDDFNKELIKHSISHLKRGLALIV
jgi:hypothetical protein